EKKQKGFPAGNETPVVIENLTKAYGEHVVFRDLSLTFPAGRTTCLMAPSGAGKTTLLRILMGLETPDRGTVTGLETKRISAVFQEPRLCENLSAFANIRMVRRKSSGRKTKGAGKRSAAACRSWDWADVRDSRSGKCPAACGRESRCSGRCTPGGRSCFWMNLFRDWTRRAGSGPWLIPGNCVKEKR